MPPVKGPGVVPEPHAVAVEPARRRIRVRAGGLWVGDSDRAVLLHEVAFTPRWYLPWEDVRSDLLTANGKVVPTAARGPARWWDLLVGDRVIADAAWDHPDPPAACPPLDGLMSFEWNLMDAWYQEDDEVRVHALDPYTRVEVLRSSRHVRVELAGRVIAESRRPLLVIETGVPVRYYLPLADVDQTLLRRSDSFTGCPYKGRASYWDVVVDGTVHHDLFWAYEEPLVPVAAIAGHVSPFAEFVDLWVDGVLQDRPDTKWAHHGPNAYTFRPGDAAWDPAAPVGWRGDDAGVTR